MVSSIGSQVRKLEAEVQNQSKEASKPDPAITTSVDERTPIITMSAVRHALTLEDGQSLNLRETSVDDQVKSLKAQVSQKDKLLKQLRDANNGNQKQRGGGEHDHDMRYRYGENGHKSHERKCKPENVKKHREARRRLKEEGKTQTPSEQSTSTATNFGDLKKTWANTKCSVKLVPSKDILIDPLEDGGAPNSIIGFDPYVVLCNLFEHAPDIGPRLESDPLTHAYGTDESSTTPVSVLGRGVVRFPLRGGSHLKWEFLVLNDSSPPLLGQIFCVVKSANLFLWRLRIQCSFALAKAEKQCLHISHPLVIDI